MTRSVDDGDRTAGDRRGGDAHSGVGAVGRNGSDVVAVAAVTLQRARRAWHLWRRPYVSTAAAAIAYRTLFSIAPLLVLAIAVLGRVVGASTAHATVLAFAADALGVPITGPLADAVSSLLEAITHPGAQLRASAVATVLVLLGALGVFDEVRLALNLLWSVEVRRGRRGLAAVALARLVGLTLVLGGGVLVALSLATARWIATTARALGVPAHWVPAADPLDRAVIFVLITVLFACVYRGFSDSRPRWRDVWGGALITATLFSLAKGAFAAYVVVAGVGSVYGAAGALVVLVLWVYVSAWMMLFGAAWVGAKASTADAGRGARLDPVSPEGKID